MQNIYGSCSTARKWLFFLIFLLKQRLLFQFFSPRRRANSQLSASRCVSDAWPRPVSYFQGLQDKWEERQRSLSTVHQPQEENTPPSSASPAWNSDTSPTLTLTLTLTLPTSQAHMLLERWSLPASLLECGHLRRSATFRPFEGSAPVVTAGPTALLCRPQREPRKLL